MDDICDLEDTRRSPQGERGLKYDRDGEHYDLVRRSPQGERGLKSYAPPFMATTDGRSPQGERGLKYNCSGEGVDCGSVAPRKGSVD